MSIIEPSLICHKTHIPHPSKDLDSAFIYLSKSPANLLVSFSLYLICSALYNPFQFVISFSVQSPPKIVKQPPTDELLFQVKSRPDENDKPFIIECEADGEPAPE